MQNIKPKPASTFRNGIAGYAVLGSSVKLVSPALAAELRLAANGYQLRHSRTISRSEDSDCIPIGGPAEIGVTNVGSRETPTVVSGHSQRGQSRRKKLVRRPGDELRQKQGDKEVIVIEPAQPDTIYVPVVYGPWPYPASSPYYFGARTTRLLGEHVSVVTEQRISRRPQVREITPGGRGRSRSPPASPSRFRSLRHRPSPENRPRSLPRQRVG
jgi:Protein of unknown function (DUF3300)